MFGRIFTKERGVSQCGAYILLTILAERKLLDEEYSIPMIKYINYFSTVYNWGKLEDRIFTAEEKKGMFKLKDQITSIKSEDDIFKIFNQGKDEDGDK